MFGLALDAAERALESGDHEGARESIQRALERDRRSIEAWDLRARWAKAIEDRDELVWSLHKRHDLAVAQGRERAEIEALRTELVEADPYAEDLLGMRKLFMRKLVTIAEKYEKDDRAHSAIEIWKKVLALDPENTAAQEAIERIASRPDPSLAGDAKPKDLFEDVSEEWIREHDEEHLEWGQAATLTRDNYTTRTNAGYEVLVRSAEAMEQMNAFYRRFFRYGGPDDSRNVGRIDLLIFKNRDEYLKLGSGPAEWSGGQFTGGSVETFVGDRGFEGMTGTLFHEAAHQFVSLATSASGWLNEGLASFFEGTRILPNGTVIMNLPATHRLFPLVERMERGWMSDAQDGMDPNDVTKTPEKAPTFGIVLENRYTWGPPWYAPTWGVVYFLYNYQDLVDGRFVYRDAFQEFINSSGGRRGSGAIKNFEEVVLANPKPPIEGFERPAGSSSVSLPQTASELDAVWKQWLLDLRNELQGSLDVERPYLDWGRAAVLDEDWETAREHFEKGLVENPGDVETLLSFADLLKDHLDNSDRAAKLVLQALNGLERAPERDEKRIRELEKLLGKIDPERRSVGDVMEEMAAAVRGLVQRYDSAGLQLMLMDIAWRFGRDLGLTDLFELYEAAHRRSGKSLEIWSLAYDERGLEGWNARTDSIFTPDGPFLNVKFGEYDAENFDFRLMTVDNVVGGDFSMEAEVQAGKGEINFCGLAFGAKSDTNFHGLLYFPGKEVAAGGAQTGFVDLMSAFGGGNMKTWRHVPVAGAPVSEEGEVRTVSGTAWHKLRVDVAGRFVEIYFDEELLATHEFGSVDVVRGGFGLLCGPGAARYRNIRYLGRDEGDPAAQIHRTVRLEKLEAEGGSATGGSYQGRIPPFPKIGRWVQGERKGWDEVGSVPQLLVFFSIEQNDLVPIDEWLSDLAARSEDFGLEVVCVASPNDDEAIEDYLNLHPMPGAVAVDQREGVGIGDTFELYDIRRFNLPRLILIDVDRKVSWEGDPGFEIGGLYDPSERSFLADPLDNLVASRKLIEVEAWTVRWESEGLPALAAGDLQAALPLLLASSELPSGYFPAVDSAQSRLGAVQSSIKALAVTAQSLEREEAQPALEVLLEWAPLFEVEVDRKLNKELKPFQSNDVTKDWTEASRNLVRFAKKKNEVLEKVDALVTKLEDLKGRFPRELAADLKEAAAAGDASRLISLAEGASARPREWLVHEFFGW